MQTTRDLNAKIPLKVKFGYGTSGFCSFITWTAFSFYGLYFMTEVVGMSAAFAGALISLGTLWDAITDPIVGSISDNLKNPKGRRRPLIKMIAIPFVLISCLLFTNFGLGETGSKIYFLVVIILYYLAQTILDISASSLGSEMSNNYDERASLATWKNYFGLLPTVAISACLMLVDFWSSKFSNPDLGWTATIACYMVPTLIFLCILYKLTGGYERPRDENEEAIHWSFQNVLALFKNKGTRIVMMIFGIGIFANTINYSVQVYYYTEYMGMTSEQVALATFVFGVASVFCAYLVEKLMIKLDKKMSWMVAIGLEALVLIVAIGFFIKAGSSSMLALMVTMLLMGLGNAAVYQVPWAMIPDCVDVDQLANPSGKRNDGIVFGAVAFVQKACGALGALVLGILIDMAAGDPNAYKYIFAFLVGGIYLLTCLIVKAYPISKQRHDDVIEAIEARANGQTIQMADFKDLI